MARNQQIGRSSNPKVERIINLRAALDVALMLLNPRRRDDSTKELTSSLAPNGPAEIERVFCFGACRRLYQCGSLICDSGARPHAVRPRTARTIQISKHAPMKPAIR